MQALAHGNTRVKIKSRARVAMLPCHAMPPACAPRCVSNALVRSKPSNVQGGARLRHVAGRAQRAARCNHDAAVSCWAGAPHQPPGPHCRGRGCSTGRCWRLSWARAGSANKERSGQSRPRLPANRRLQPRATQHAGCLARGCAHNAGNACCCCDGPPRRRALSCIAPPSKCRCAGCCGQFGLGRVLPPPVSPPLVCDAPPPLLCMHQRHCATPCAGKAHTQCVRASCMPLCRQVSPPASRPPSAPTPSRPDTPAGFLHASKKHPREQAPTKLTAEKQCIATCVQGAPPAPICPTQPAPLWAPGQSANGVGPGQVSIAGHRTKTTRRTKPPASIQRWCRCCCCC